MNMQMVATCLLGVEGLVADELRNMNAENVSAQNGRVFFEGDETILARANIWSRFSERILIVVDTFRAYTFDDLFERVKTLPWAEFIGSTDTFPVKGYSIASVLHSVPDCQSIIKKAIVESLKEDYNISWFEESGPIHQVQFSIMKDEVTIMLDTSGKGLHKRGYRPVGNDAPIRETLAAAMCSLSRLRHYHTMYDPCCGSGTVLIEGALLANNIAPGINRNFDVDRWGFIPESVWMSERERCRDLIKTDTDFVAFGTDIDPKAIELTLKMPKISESTSLSVLRLQILKISTRLPSEARLSQIRRTASVCLMSARQKRFIALWATNSLQSTVGAMASFHPTRSLKNASAERLTSAANFTTA